jgi:hypothetical protein
MSDLTVNNQSDLLAFIKENLTNDKNLSIRGLARLCDIDDRSLIKGAEFVSQKLGQTLIEHGFTSAELLENGFDAKACWLVIEYYAYESKAKALGAKQIARTFGQIGLMTTFDKLTEAPAPPLPTPQSDVDNAVKYIEAADKLEQLNDKTLQQLLRNELIDALSVKQGQQPALAPSMPNNTTVKVRAKELGYTTTEVDDGTGLGKWVAKRVPVLFKGRIDKYMVNHYVVTPEFDAAIHSYFNQLKRLK